MKLLSLIPKGSNRSEKVFKPFWTGGQMNTMIMLIMSEVTAVIIGTKCLPAKKPK